MIKFWGQVIKGQGHTATKYVTARRLEHCPTNLPNLVGTYYGN